MNDKPESASPHEFEFGPGYLEGLTASKRAKRDGEIQWQDWGDSPFELAKSQDKLVLLDITAPWCHWCHVMDETTFSAPNVIDFINENFIAIRVHADRHPEVEKAYLSGGWPTTALLLPSGETLSSLTYVAPDNMLKWMSEVLRVYEEQKDDIEGQVAAQRAGYMAQLETPVRFDGLPDLESYALKLTGDALRAFDEEHGGFGSPEHGFQPKFPQPALMEFLLTRSFAKDDPSARRMLELTLKSQQGILDKEWGGFFRYSVNRFWSVPHFEKMLFDQARILKNYLHFHLFAGEKWALDDCGEILRYIENWLTGEDWKLYSSQDADVGSHDADAPFIPGEDYFGLSDEKRRQLGIPFVEKDVISGWAAEMAEALIEYGTAMCDDKRIQTGIAALAGIWNNMRSEDGWIRRSFERTAQATPVLPDQTAFGNAALFAHSATGDLKWLERARKIAGVIKGYFEDENSGGFFFSPYRGKQRGNLLFIGKPFEENADAAAFFARMELATGERTYGESAMRALASAAPSAGKYGFLGSSYYHALHLVEAGLRFAVVQPEGKEANFTGRTFDAKAATAVFGTFVPGRVVRHISTAEELGMAESSGLKFTSGKNPAVYICTVNSCLPAIDLHSETASADMASAAKGFLK